MGAANIITEECERLFCETLKAVFLGERNMAEGSLVDDAHIPIASDGYFEATEQVQGWVEVWDYTGGARFRGFVSGGAEKSLFVFFDRGAVGKDLKHGLMALIELAGTPYFDCSTLVVCLDRTSGSGELKNLIRDLGWVGFEMTTLDRWSNQRDVTSEQWLFLGMDV